jgi:DNA-binding transcriptional LysR family regulator
MFEIRELHHLLSIDEFRHFGRAAQAVGLSQPALTKSLQRFETALGAKLFERSRANVTPTPVGKEVLIRARRLVKEAAALKRAVDQLSGVEVGSVTIGVGPAMSESYVADAIAEVSNRHPQTHISIRMDHWRQLSTWLLAGELDFYVADVGEARIDGRFHYTSLPPQQFVWFCRAGHPLAVRKRRAITRVDLLRFPIATPKMPPWATEWFAAAHAELGAAGPARPLPSIECESYAMLKRIVTTSDCISAALPRTISRELDEGLLVAMPIDAPELTTHAGIIRLKDPSSSKLALELIEAIENQAK